uniref:Uncharacterized protein n=1 Tax=Anguilla anguilla TaxID=7936 RepID=A0A0E9RYJ9_ANGAN
MYATTTVTPSYCFSTYTPALLGIYVFVKLEKSGWKGRCGLNRRAPSSWRKETA